MNIVRRWTAFNLVGAAGIAVQIGIIAFLVRVCGWHYLLATALAVEVAVLHNFAWHQRWTWNDRPAGSARSIASRFVRFQMLNGVISLAGNLILMRILAGLFGIDPIVANIAAIVTCATLNFAASETVVFRTARCLPVLILILAAGAHSSLSAQGVATLTGWERYQSSLDARYESTTNASTFFIHDREGGQRNWRGAVRAGGISVVQLDAPSIEDGRIHHWVGAVFVPGVGLEALLRRLKEQAGHESAFYDDVVESRLLGKDGDRLRVFMKLRRTSLITVTYNTEHAVEYRTLGEARSSARSVATRIAELTDAGTPHEREKLPGQDNGFLWRLGAYWRYEAVAGGVLVECESVSLSRPVPMLLRPMASPIVDRIARESLERTLRSLRKVVTAENVRQANNH
jgi:putative flippase GtrA